MSQGSKNVSGYFRNLGSLKGRERDIYVDDVVWELLPFFTSAEILWANAS